MARTKISEFSATAASNTDIDSINIAEGCAPSGINDAIRELMSQLKDFQTGAVGDSFNGPVGTTTAAAGAFTTLSASSTLAVTGVATLTAQPILSSLTASRAVFTDASKGLVSNAITGTGNVVMSTSPTLVTPTLGVATATSLQGIIGNVTPAAGAFTTVDASGAVTLSGGTANGVTYLNGSKVLTSGSALVFDGATLGVGVTPSSWSLLTGLQVKNASLGAYLNRAYVIANAYYNGGFKYIASDFSSNYTQSGGIHSWFTAPSGTAGNAVTFTETMSINVNGGLTTLNTIGVGNATPSTSGAGITFPATQSASTDANTLDDYEEGTWTPSYSGGVTGVTYGSVRNGYYRKIGSQVTIWFGIMTDGLTVTASALSITGLPFTSASGAGSNGTVNISNATRWVSSPPIVGAVNTSATSIVLYNSIGATGAGVDPVEVTTGNMSTGSGNRNLCFGTATYSA